LQAQLQQKNELRIKTNESIEKNQLRLKKQQEESRRKELELTRKCEEEVAKRDKLSAARAELEIKHFEEKQGKMDVCSPPAIHHANGSSTEFSHSTLHQIQLLRDFFLIKPQRS